ncbi:hypothetical protein GMES_2018 [Paraglaciecola mesophila KMM 241]|uniref:Uncharacterized protein n=1 Tax=Paraglaciecola mesophila KMM 241 TaxID=1128912 RepID=K6XUP2_9ALTE|nr:hypothetical protein GMES_2018 [Paraglaciecola mesophila KMM 241]
MLKKPRFLTFIKRCTQQLSKYQAKNEADHLQKAYLTLI